MTVKENRCVSCGLPCLGNSCSYGNATVIICDECKEDASYRYEGQDYCEDCLKEKLATAVQSEYDEYDDWEDNFEWEELFPYEKAALLGYSIERL